MDQIKHLEEKLACCEEMIQKKPTLASGYCDKGLLLRALKRFEEGLAAFDQASQLDRYLPSSPPSPRARLRISSTTAVLASA